jgi:isopentenyldiphosphate isomerase
MKELIDLVDEQNNVIGVTDAETAHDKKQLHRIVGVFLFDTEGNMCLQNGNKYNKYDLSVGGHVQQGEACDEAAQREMMEELNVTVPLTHLSTFLPENAKMAHFWSLYCGELPSEWVFSPTEEVSSVILMSMKEVSEKLESSPELFTHGLANAFAEFSKVKNIID